MKYGLYKYNKFYKLVAVNNRPYEIKRFIECTVNFLHSSNSSLGTIVYAYNKNLFTNILSYH